jgi:hypothetical protein
MHKLLLAVILLAGLAACTDTPAKDDGQPSDATVDTSPAGEDTLATTDVAVEVSSGDVVALPQGCTADSDCSTGVTCLPGTCDSGICRLQPAPSTQQCDDGDACSTADHCLNGACKGALVSCDDANPCTSDGCAPATGCSHTPNTAKCDDGNACTVAEVCASGSCQGGQIVDCDDGNPCTQDSCHLTQGCKHTATPGVSCSDGDACTTKDTCVANICAGKAMNCDDGEDCTSDSCAGGLCAHEDGDGPCSDGDVCTTADKCVSGKCTGTVLACDDGNICTTDFCGGGKCQAGVAPVGAGCDDGDLCTYNKCHGGTCVAAQKYWSQTLSGTELKGLVPQADGVVVFGLRGGFGWIGWYSNGGELVKEEALPPAHVAATASGALLVVTANGVSRRTAKGQVEWTTVPESFTDGMGTGKPVLDYVAASGELVTVFGSVTTGKFKRAFVARYSAQGVLQWQIATPPEKGANFPLRTATSTGHVIAQSNTLFAPAGAPSAVWYSWNPQGQLNVEVPFFSVSAITPTKDGNVFLPGKTAQIYTPMLTPVSAPVVVPGGGGHWAAQEADGFSLLGWGKLSRFDGQGNLHSVAAQVPKLTAAVSDGDGLYAYRVVTLSNNVDKDSQIFRLDRYGHVSCNICATLGTNNCADGDACSLDDCDLVSGCTVAPHSCDDGLPCTLDSCLPATGCAHQAVTTGPCDDGDPCTIDGNCTTAGCSVVPKCDDGNPCTYDNCSQSGNGECYSFAQIAGASCGDAGRCTTAGECLTEFCETNTPLGGPYTVNAGKILDIPFEVTLTSSILWARYEAVGNGDSTVSTIEFGNKSMPSSGGRRASSGDYWEISYPRATYTSSSAQGIADVIPTGTWKLRLSQQTNNDPTKPPGKVESVVITFGYICPK